MEKIKELLLFQQQNTTSILDFVYNLILCILFSSIISVLYARYGFSLTNKRKFSQNFLLLSITTMFVIAIVKSSLALSLGLVGALSIVRFRTPIKEPEELIMLFLNISIGLGLGADQRMITLVSTMFFGGIIYIRHFRSTKKINDSDMLIIVQYNGLDVSSYTDVISFITENSTEATLKKIEHHNNYYELLMEVNFENLDKLKDIINGLSEKNLSLEISVMNT